MNQKNVQLQTFVMAALLCAIAIMIPIFCPLKVVIPPMSFTLASHVAIIIAMFISPSVAVVVELGATLGFFLAGLPPVIALRALSQVFFVVVGAYWLKKKPNTFESFGSMSIWVLVTGVIHGVAEALVGTYFYFYGTIDQAKGFFFTIVILVGVGTLVHHIVDFTISYFIWKPVSKVIRIPASIHFNKKEVAK